MMCLTEFLEDNVDIKLTFQQVNAIIHVSKKAKFFDSRSIHSLNGQPEVQIYTPSKMFGA